MEKIKVFNICLYCGTGEKERLSTEKGLMINKNVVEKLKDCQKENAIYWLKVCPACNTIIDIIKKQTLSSIIKRLNK